MLSLTLRESDASRKTSSILQELICCKELIRRIVSPRSNWYDSEFHARYFAAHAANNACREFKRLDHKSRLILGWSRKWNVIYWDTRTINASKFYSSATLMHRAHRGACLYEGREIKIRSRRRGSTSSLYRGTLPPRVTPWFILYKRGGARDFLSRRGAPISPSRSWVTLPFGAYSRSHARARWTLRADKVFLSHSS